MYSLRFPTKTLHVSFVRSLRATWPEDLVVFYSTYGDVLYSFYCNPKDVIKVPAILRNYFFAAHIIIKIVPICGRKLRIINSLLF